MNRTTDSMLLERLPDDDAMRELYARYSRLVYSTSLGVLHRRDLAEDATQSVFLILLAKARELECSGSLAPWLYVASLRAAHGIAKSERARSRRERGSQHRGVPKLEPPSDLILEIGRLSRLDRQLLLLRHIQGMTFGEIGDQLGLSQAAARMRLERLHAKLRQRLSGAYSLALLSATFSHEPLRRERTSPAPQPSLVRIGSSRGVIAMQTFLRIVSATAFVVCLGIMFRIGNANGPQDRPFPTVHVGPAPKGIPFAFRTPNGPYRLTYSYQLFRPGKSAVLRTGTVSITEAKGALMIQSLDKDATSSMVFANGRTLRMRLPNDRSHYDAGHSSVLYHDGFAMGDGLDELRLPFNFESVPLYRPLQERIDALIHDKVSSLKVLKALRKALAESRSNLALVANPSVDRQGLVEGTFTTMGGESTLLVGSEPRKWIEFHYTDSSTAIGVPVPKTIEMVVYDFPTAVATSTVPTQQYKLRLQSIETNPSRIAKPSPEAVLPKGQWISYNGYGRKSAGVIFNPKGSLDQQVEEQLDLRSHTSAR